MGCWVHLDIDLCGFSGPVRSCSFEYILCVEGMNGLLVEKLSLRRQVLSVAEVMRHQDYGFMHHSRIVAFDF